MIRIACAGLRKAKNSPCEPEGEQGLFCYQLRFHGLLHESAGLIDSMRYPMVHGGAARSMHINEGRLVSRVPLMSSSVGKLQ